MVITVQSTRYGAGVRPTNTKRSVARRALISGGVLEGEVRTAAVRVNWASVTPDKKCHA
ncbi:hypothetical protein SULPSESMR1_01142 [Pseudosulfitobacter pseudonitzschiae]|uniref:Uncharacterized protein n=1 Tax=Pseudosulfitobacter pseudonitzschiae TaxID=1402135 RepID=A0A221JZF1_9RHOB|nr:hypothetical protein SULPSESMR1_01142 [Pseudosulfitobacter pseudonitzschiae]